MILPLTEDYWHKWNKTKSKCGFKSRCKECRKIQFKQYYLKNKEHLNKNSRDRDRQSSIKAGMSIRKLHHRIRKQKPLPKYCTICNQNKKLELSSINHSYTKDIGDWLWLCRSCHIVFDNKN